MSLKEQLTDDMKTAMRAKEAGKLGTIRLILAEIKRKEVDERIDVSDEQVLVILEKMIKQRKDSITQFEAGGRADLADIEKAELAVLATYMPAGLSEAEIVAAVAEAVAASGAAGPQDMGKVMAIIKPKMPKGTDMGVVSAMIKQALAPA
ncbi:MAG: GatB/YqeY domain-containing protein [Pseudomonadota bacterium]|nr:GatB/YqeY domain-containing protein [Pseudomonadota bacterium]